MMNKMTTNFVESFNDWLKEECLYTSFNLVMTHMDKFAHLACDHMGTTENWKALIGPKTEEKLFGKHYKEWVISCISLCWWCV